MSLLLLSSLLIGALPVSGADTTALTIGEASTVRAQRQVSDTQSLAVTESSSLVQTGVLPVTGADAVALGVSESAARGIILSQGDSLALQVSQASVSALSSQRADSPTLTVSEASASTLFSQLTDAATLMITEQGAVRVPRAVSDTLSLNLADGSTLNVDAGPPWDPNRALLSHAATRAISLGEIRAIAGIATGHLAARTVLSGSTAARIVPIGDQRTISLQ
jgi:hypothetical protein